MLSHAILSPYPPAIIPRIGGADARAFPETIDALLDIAQTLRADPPDTLIILGTQGELEADRVVVRVPTALHFRTDMRAFGGGDDLAREYPRDRVATAQLIEALAGRGVPTTISPSSVLDFSASVPLFYLASALPSVAIVSLLISLHGPREHALLGEAIAEVADQHPGRVAFLGAAQLGHVVGRDSPHGFHAAAAAFDEELVADLRAGSFDRIAACDPFLIDEYGLEQYRVLCALGGVLDARLALRFLRYEAPGGIGCATGLWVGAGGER